MKTLALPHSLPTHCRVGEHELPKLIDILTSVTPEHLASMQAALAHTSSTDRAPSGERVEIVLLPYAGMLC